MNTPSSKTTKHRQSIRLKGYDYAQPGWYFVTICTHNQECIFGEVIDGEMRSNEYGRIVADEWLRTEHVRPNVILDSFIVMPNHTHAIIIIADAAPHSANAAPSRPKGPTSGSLGAIVGQIKSACTKRINRRRGTPGAAVWHRNYHEHIIRSEAELTTIRRYVQENPVRWEVDCCHPAPPTP